MKDTKSVLDHMFAPMIQKYLERLRSREAQIASLVEKLENGTMTRGESAELRREAHHLAGSGGTYGFPAISEAGFALERALEEKRDKSEILSLARALQQSCHAVQFLESSGRGRPARKPTIVGEFPAVNGEAVADKPRKRVLLIDDDPAIQGIITNLLQRDAEVIVAPHVDMGVEITKRREPDLVLLDIDLPVANGMTYLRAMRQDERYCHIPVVMLTVYQRGADVVQAMRAGAVGYIIKPIDSTTFPGYVRALLLHADTTVLVADDDEAISDLMAAKFRSFGARVVQSRLGDALPALIAKHHPDLIVVDWNLSGLDPAAPEKALMGLCGEKKPKCVVLHGAQAGREKIRRIWPHADDLFSKPFTPAEVVARCLKILGLPGYEPIPSGPNGIPKE